ncbi:hypothetical protein NE237_024509 [Protea cynaroides]|uniref:Pentatricopeptide repeat-containing protein n=1 Tax=Protea cynaroides TaxID=273540 RepID=A0A9Q0H339_9MAGN|nr:hypothetical protein NE237_024509 [Protea cynaroides]
MFGKYREWLQLRSSPSPLSLLSIVVLFRYEMPHLSNAFHSDELSGAPETELGFSDPQNLHFLLCKTSKDADLAKDQAIYKHDTAANDLMIDILGKVRKFDVAWQLIVEMDQQNLRPTSKTFRILIRRLWRRKLKDSHGKVGLQVSSKGVSSKGFPSIKSFLLLYPK